MCTLFIFSSFTDWSTVSTMAMPAAGRKRKRKRTFATKRKLFVGQRVEVIQCRFCFTFINAFFLIDFCLQYMDCDFPRSLFFWVFVFFVFYGYPNEFSVVIDYGFCVSFI